MKERYEQFSSLITNINRYIQKIKNFEMEELGLKGNQVQCLFFLYKEHDGLNARQLCSLCGEDKAAISRTLKELEKFGYVFVDEDGQKKYRKAIKLTDQGEKIGQYILNKIDEIFVEGSKGVGENERKILYEALARICENLRKVCEEDLKGEKDEFV